MVVSDDLFRLGERDRALFWLEKSYEGREHDLVFSNVWPMFDSLRSDSRFKDMLRRIGLSPAAETASFAGSLKMTSPPSGEWTGDTREQPQN